MSLFLSHFPNPETADEHGIVAVSQTITVPMLLDAYSHGIFPWTDDPVLWFSPDPRAVFLHGHVRIPHRVGRWMKQHDWRITYDLAFSDVMMQCAQAKRPHENSTWITDRYLEAYGELHQQGYGHSVEVWQGTQLVGGIYGVHIRGLFAGESMFHAVPNASKVAFAYLWVRLLDMGVTLLDAQVSSPFIHQLGATLISRSRYLDLLQHAMAVCTKFEGVSWPEVSLPWEQVRTQFLR